MNLDDLDLSEVVRYHGAFDVLDAVLAVAEELYGDKEKAVAKTHAVLLTRAMEFAG